MKDIADWFLAFAQSVKQPLTQRELSKLIHATIVHAKQDDVVIGGIPLGPSAWADVLGAYLYIGRGGDELVSLSRNFNFAVFTDEESDFLVTIWNTYGKGNDA